MKYIRFLKIKKSDIEYVLVIVNMVNVNSIISFIIIDFRKKMYVVCGIVIIKLEKVFPLKSYYTMLPSSVAGGRAEMASGLLERTERSGGASERCSRSRCCRSDLRKCGLASSSDVTSTNL